MRKIYLILYLFFVNIALFAQVKPDRAALKSDRATPLQATDISPMINKPTINVNNGFRFSGIANNGFASLSALQKKASYRNGLHFVRTPDTGLPYFIKGTPNDWDGNADLARQYELYFSEIADEMQCENPAEEFVFTMSETDRLDITHTRFEQYFSGIKVYDSEVILHSKNNTVFLFNGRFFPTPDLSDVMPTVNANTALTTVKNAVGISETVSVTPGFEFLIADETEVSELVIYHTDGDIDREKLAWHITYIPTLADRFEYFIDAKTGEILHSFNNVCRFHSPLAHKEDGHTACTHTTKKENVKTENFLPLPPPDIATAPDLLGINRTVDVYQTGGTYFMIDAARTAMFEPAQSTFPDDAVGVIWTIDGMNNNVEGNNFNVAHVTDNDNNWNNPTGISAHFNGGAAYEYFEEVHSRISINGQGGNIVSIINVEDAGGPMDNAFWNGQAIFYGNGTTAFKPLARGLDVAGHEMSHGVIQSTANLEYEGESGALNESFADIFGAMIDRDDWKIGEDVVEFSSFPSGALRDMANPNQGGSSLADPGYQPAHTDEQYTGNQDNGGVHINSGIPNKAFQLFATAVGKDKAEEIYYRALTQYLVRSSQFIDCRAAVEQAAQDLYGNTEVQAAQSAFNAVGIGEGGGVGDNADNGNSQNDFEPNPGQDYLVFKDEFSSVLKLYRPDGTPEADPFTTNPPLSKPSVTDDGTAVVYVATDKTLQLLDIDWVAGTYEQLTLNPDPIWLNIAVARDGTRIAALTDDLDERVYIYDFTLDVGEFFTLYNPTYTQGVSTGDVIYADVLEWDFTGNWVMYDAFNRIDGNFGNDIEYWDIGFVNVFDHNALQFGSGEIQKLFTGLPEDVSVGNPTFAKNSDYIIAFDYIDEFENDYELRAANLQTGDVGTIFNNVGLSYPNYSPDDSQLVFDAQTNNGNDVLAFIDLNADKISPAGEGFLFIGDGQQAVWFAEGDRNFTITEDLLFDENTVRVSPNPFYNEVSVEFTLQQPAEVDFTLTDISGKIIDTQKRTAAAGTQAQRLQFEVKAAGIYFLRMQAENESVVLKLVKI